MTEDERRIVALFARIQPGADLAWGHPVSDPPDALSADGKVGLELTRLAPSDGSRAGSPITRRQSLRDRILLRGQSALKASDGRGFRVHVIWNDDKELLTKSSVTLGPDLAEVVRGVVADVNARAVAEPAGDLVLYGRDFAGHPLAEYAASISVSWTLGTTEWDCAGSAASVCLLSGRPLRTIINRKNADLARWTISPAYRWLVLHLDPSTFTDDPAVVSGPYTFDFDRVFLIDTVELTCREIRRTP